MHSCFNLDVEKLNQGMLMDRADLAWTQESIDCTRAGKAILVLHDFCSTMLFVSPAFGMPVCVHIFAYLQHI